MKFVDIDIPHVDNFEGLGLSRHDRYIRMGVPLNLKVFCICWYIIYIRGTMYLDKLPTPPDRTSQSLKLPVYRAASAYIQP